MERWRAGSLVLVAKTAGPGARPRRRRLDLAWNRRRGRVSSRAEPGVGRAGTGTRSENGEGSGERLPPRYDPAGTAAGRQHARLQPRVDRVARAVDVGRALTRTRGRTAERAPPVFRSRTETCGRT